MGFKTVPQKRGKRLVVQFTDGTSQIEMVWFRGHKWIQEQLKRGVSYVAFGRLSWYGNKASMVHPELTLGTGIRKELSQCFTSRISVNRKAEQ